MCQLGDFAEEVLGLHERHSSGELDVSQVADLADRIAAYAARHTLGLYQDVTMLLVLAQFIDPTVPMDEAEIWRTIRTARANGAPAPDSERGGDHG